MKTKLILFLLCLASLSVMGQGVIPREKCKTCGKVISQCSYKGKHPMKTCSTCGKALSKCQYKGKHPEKTCSTCGKVLSKCQYKGKHPEKTCSTCGNVISQCQYRGNHPAPEPSGYDVSFTCNVPNATLVIDGRNYGSPSGTIYMKSGEHSVILTAEGYKVYNQKITVDKNNNSFNFVMENYQELQATSSVDISENQTSTSSYEPTDNNSISTKKKNSFNIKLGIGTQSNNEENITCGIIELEYGISIGKRFYLMPALALTNNQFSIPVNVGYLIPITSGKTNCVIKFGVFYGTQLWDVFEGDGLGISYGIDYKFSKHWVLGLNCKNSLYEGIDRSSYHTRVTDGPSSYSLTIGYRF